MLTAAIEKCANLNFFSETTESDSSSFNILPSIAKTKIASLLTLISAIGVSSSLFPFDEIESTLLCVAAMRVFLSLPKKIILLKVDSVLTYISLVIFKVFKSKIVSFPSRVGITTNLSTTKGFATRMSIEKALVDLLL